MEKKTMTIKHLPSGETRLINAHRFNAEIHELIDQKAKKAPVIEAIEGGKTRTGDEFKELKEKEGFECEECGQICKSVAGLKLHMKKHDK